MDAITVKIRFQSPHGLVIIVAYRAELGVEIRQTDVKIIRRRVDFQHLQMPTEHRRLDKSGPVIQPRKGEQPLKFGVLSRGKFDAGAVFCRIFGRSATNRYFPARFSLFHPLFI